MLLETRFDITWLEDATETLRAIAHPIRLAIVDLLTANEEMSVSEIHDSLKIEQAVASHHLRILKDKRIVRSKRQGKNTLYSLRSKTSSRIIPLLEELI